MKKVWFISFLSLILVIGMVGCKQEADLSPTGYPNNEVQRVSVYSDGKLYYESSDSVEAPPAESKLLGTIIADDPARFPKEDLHAAHIEVGAEVYRDASEDILYVDMYGTWKIFRELIL